MVRSPVLLVLTDTARFPDPVGALAPLFELLPQGQVGLVVRDRELSRSAWMALAESCLGLTERTQQRLILAHHFDQAASLSPFGLHLPSGGPSPSKVRAERDVAWISRSFHDYASLPAEEQAALDAVLVSPALAPRKGRAPLGLERLGALAVALAPRQVYALGGVGPSEVSACLSSGARGVAMLEAAYRTPPEVLARPFIESLSEKT